MSTTATQPNTEKRGRGRPKGSATRNRLQEPPVLVMNMPRRQRVYSQVEAAAELGMDRLTLHRRALKHPVYQPAGKDEKKYLYTDRQLDILVYVMTGRITEDQGLDWINGIEDAELAMFEQLARHGR